MSSQSKIRPTKGTQAIARLTAKPVPQTSTFNVLNANLHDIKLWVSLAGRRHRLKLVFAAVRQGRKNKYSSQNVSQDEELKLA